jgi:hypothetical protein
VHPSQMRPPTQRQHVAPTVPLTEEQMSALNTLFGGDASGSFLPVDPSQVNPATLRELAEVMKAQSLAGMKPYNTKRDATIPVGPGSAYGQVLELAKQKVRAFYGEMLQEAVTLSGPDQASYFESGVTLHQVDDRWQAVKNNDETVRQQAGLAAQYLADTDPEVRHKLTSIAEQFPDELQLGAQQAYLNALLTSNDLELFRILAEYRVRWPQYTRFADIYTETLAVKTMTLFDAWSIYRVLLHELLHTAAHRAFTQYLIDEVPPHVSALITEGATEYFAHEAWKRIVGALPKQGPDIAIVQATKAAGKDKLAPVTLSNIKLYVEDSLYPLQEGLIREAIDMFPDGLNRLKAAYFYGDISCFFPSYKQEAQAISTELSTTAAPSTTPIAQPDPSTSGQKRVGSSEGEPAPKRQKISENDKDKG